MGYTTTFTGEFVLSDILSSNQHAYLKAFSETRRMKRDSSILRTMPDPVREAVGLPIGNEGVYFVGGGGFAGQDHDASILDYNDPPEGQPGLWCKWVPNEDGTAIEWSGAEKFYSYLEWLRYLIDHFLRPWGYDLSGTVEWSGESHGDEGKIVCSKGGNFRVHKKVYARKGSLWEPQPVMV